MSDVWLRSPAIVLNKKKKAGELRLPVQKLQEGLLVKAWGCV